MTGTADTEAYEFQQIYNLETVVIPTNRPMIRKDENDQIYRTAPEKYNAIIADIRACHQRGQPVLVGTTSIENSELLSGLLDKEKLSHQVLNAKQHAREAEIVAQAGRPGMITIATNMAGRGTDIVLGGNIEKPLQAIRDDEGIAAADKEARIAQLKAEWQKVHDQVLAAGGLHIIGSERHESRRIDNQLRGRSGRQGDPGSSRFYLALDDPLLKIFAGDRLNTIMVRLKMPEGEAIEHPLVSRSLESAQRKVEQRNFDIRKQLLEYDDVSNDQRKVIYQQRNELLDSEDISKPIAAMRQGQIHDVFRCTFPPKASRSNGTSRTRGGACRRAADEAADRRVDQGRSRSWVTTRSSSACSTPVTRLSREDRAVVEPPRGPASSATSCCRASTATGANTSRRSTTCARASTCAAMPKRIRSRNTSAKPLSCSRACCRRCAPRSRAADDGAGPQSEDVADRGSRGTAATRERPVPPRRLRRGARPVPPHPRRSCRRSGMRPRSAATIRVPVAAARSTSTATAS
jgi:hypothetical protein